MGRPRRLRLGAMEIGVLVGVTIVVLVMIGMPLRNYFQQRSDIARVNASITAKEEEKQRLLGELEKYESEAFVKEQARVRLGVIEPGETAFRIISPELEAESSTGQTSERADDQQVWYDLLWDAIATEDSVVRIGGEEQAETPPSEVGRLPISPTQPPPPAEVP
ncbi:septum formation initiator family protein [Corynebacterium sp.]|uniref:FtsB family cell division protein n=1 Tax=Corynebacterium sp. TaxID=1720 RepID=UPI0026DDAE73|nr:septum formation initiator family protein [Corynebacterium sp.]MDO5076395.1 septum formation initiator family protein [Corynebacterium sp.]